MTVEKNPKEPEHDWVPISEASPDGYWLQLNPRGLPDKNRASINVNSIEEILRNANLPPILITSEYWNPKSVTEVEGIGNELAFKKNIYAPRVPTLTSTHEPNLSVSPAEPENGDKSLSWVLKVKTNKIDHDIRMKYPRDGDKHANLFYQEWEKTVRSGIRLIGYYEMLGTRYLSEDDKTMHLMGLAATEGVSSAGLLRLDEVDSFLSAKTAEVLATYIGLSQAKGVVEMVKGHSSIPDSEVTMLRKALYPDRFAKEKHGSKVRFFSRLFPGGLMAEPAILAFTSLLTHPNAFVRVKDRL